tara:strand:+ start:278 stop:547 length:270 start_codon:yes stop_codon:yes gene_type:complete
MSDLRDKLTGRHGIKYILPLLHRLIGMMFWKMESKGMDVEWYKDTVGALLAHGCISIYKNPKKDWERYLKMVEDEYDSFAEEFNDMPEA